MEVAVAPEDQGLRGGDADAQIHPGGDEKCPSNTDHQNAERLAQVW